MASSFPQPFPVFTPPFAVMSSFSPPLKGKVESRPSSPARAASQNPFLSSPHKGKVESRPSSPARAASQNPFLSSPQRALSPQRAPLSPPISSPNRVPIMSQNMASIHPIPLMPLPPVPIHISPEPKHKEKKKGASLPASPASPRKRGQVNETKSVPNKGKGRLEAASPSSRPASPSRKASSLASLPSLPASPSSRPTSPSRKAASAAAASSRSASPSSPRKGERSHSASPKAERIYTLSRTAIETIFQRGVHHSNGFTLETINYLEKLMNSQRWIKVMTFLAEEMKKSNPETVLQKYLQDSRETLHEANNHAQAHEASLNMKLQSARTQKFNGYYPEIYICERILESVSEKAEHNQLDTDALLQCFRKRLDIAALLELNTSVLTAILPMNVKSNYLESYYAYASKLFEQKNLPHLGPETKDDLFNNGFAGYTASDAFKQMFYNLGNSFAIYLASLTEENAMRVIASIKITPIEAHYIIAGEIKVLSMVSAQLKKRLGDRREIHILDLFQLLSNFHEWPSFKGLINAVAKANDLRPYITSRLDENGSFFQKMDNIAMMRI